MKNFIECVFSTERDRSERLNKLDRFRKTLYFEIDSHQDFNIILFDILDDISLKAIDRANCDGMDSPLTRDNSDCLEIEIIDKFNELRNSIFSILVQRSKN